MKVLKGWAALVLGRASSSFRGNPIHGESPAATQWIVATGQGAGAKGERGLALLSLFNSSSLDATVELAFLQQSPLDSSGRALGDNSTAPSASVLVPAGKKLDVYPTWNPFGDGSRAGAVRVTTTGKDPLGQPLPVVGASPSRPSGRGTRFRRLSVRSIPGAGPRRSRRGLRGVGPGPVPADGMVGAGLVSQQPLPALHERRSGHRRDRDAPRHDRRVARKQGPHAGPAVADAGQRRGRVLQLPDLRPPAVRRTRR